MKQLSTALKHSLCGVLHGLRTERALRQEFAVLMFGAPFALLVTPLTGQRILLVATLLMVIAVELLNTAIEKICDFVTQEVHPQIKAVKDMASAACLLVQMTAAMVWIYIAHERFG